MSCPYQSNYRELENNIHTDFKDDMSYGDYLNLSQILTAQHPISDEHDEMLFVVIHQASELWIKLAGHELAAAISFIEKEQFGPAFKVISRVKQIFLQLTQSWNILSTLTPVDYLKFRDSLGKSSGFQSFGYRSIEFMLGNKNKALIEVHKSDDAAYQQLSSLSDAPSIYDTVLRVMAKRGFKIDEAKLNRDFGLPYESNVSVLNAWLQVYTDASTHFELYELAEKLMDIEDAFQNWRFKHMYTVQRIIGNKAGTGGSSGVEFLRKALDISFFPELIELRTKL